MNRRLSQLLSLLICLALLLGMQPLPARAQAPIASGTWTGYFERTVTITNTVSGVDIEAHGYGKGSLDLTVEASGKVTGSLAGYHAEVSWAAPAVDVKGGCSIDLDFSALDGTVTEGPDHLPVFNLDLQTNTAKTVCNPDFPTGSNPAHSVTMHAKTASGGKITGDEVRFDTDMVDQILASVASTGAKTTIEEYWELNFSGASVDVIDPEREQYFLQGVPFKNTYNAILDWHGNPPGTVDFTLNGQTQNVPDSGPASASFELGQLPAGSNPLTVTAINADGTPSGSNTYDVIIVPLEPWAKNASFKAAETKMDQITPVVIYRGKTSIPPQPIKLPYLDMSWLPAIGGKWGIPPFQLEINLSANSGGGLSDPEPVTGQPGLYLGGDTPTVAIQVDGQAVTNLTATALLFDHGQVNFNLPPTILERKVGVVDLIPGLSAYYSTPGLGTLIQGLNGVAGVSLQTIASATGKADLGVAADQSALVFTQGQIKPSIELKAQPGINLFGLAWVNVGGGGKGEFTIEIAPNPQLTQCTISLTFSASAGISGVFSQTFNQPYTLVQCQPVSLNGKPGLALYLPEVGRAEPWFVRPWSAETGVLRTFQPVIEARSAPAHLAAANQVRPAAVGSFETLAGVISPQTSYDLAVGPDGKLAFAYLELDTEGNSHGLWLLLNDGQSWRQPIAISQGEQAEFSPAVGFDGQGQVVLAWVRASQAPPSGELPGAGFFSSLEIAYARVDPSSGHVTNQGSLTEDQELDFAPQLAQAPDGSLRIAWIKSPSGELWGPVGQPNQLLSALWDDGQWGKPATVTDKLAGSLGYRLAAYRQDQALIAADQDVDGDPATATDREVFAYSLSGRSWEAIQLSDNAYLDRAPLAAFDSAGLPVVVWEQGGAPVSLRGDLKTAPQPVAIEATQPPDLSQAVLLAGGDGGLLLAWPGFDPPDSQVWYSLLPSGVSSWEPAASLAEGLDGPAGLMARVTPTGEVLLALSDQHAPAGDQGVRGLADSADLGLVRASLLQPQSGDVPQAARQTRPRLLPPFWLIGLCVLGLLVIVVLGVVAFFLLRRRK